MSIDFSELHVFVRYRKKFSVRANRKLFPTPTEFVRYIVDTAKEKGPASLDNHIKPMWTACPFCLVGFDAVAYLEESEDEFEFIAKALKIDVLHLYLVKATFGLPVYF